MNNCTEEQIKEILKNYTEIKGEIAMYPDESGELHELIKKIDIALRSLNEDQREAIMNVYIARKRWNNACADMCVSPCTLNRWLHKGISTITSMINKSWVGKITSDN